MMEDLRRKGLASGSRSMVDGEQASSNDMKTWAVVHWKSEAETR